MSMYGPAAGTQRRIIDLLRADGALSASPGGLLYPEWSPKVDDDDTRIYSVSAHLPPDSEFVNLLPRILIEVVQRAHDYEQEQPGVLQGPVRVWTHTVVPREEEELGERIDAYLTGVLLSTVLSDARIIAARLSLEGDRRRVRVEAFNGAWQFISGYLSPNVGALT